MAKAIAYIAILFSFVYLIIGCHHDFQENTEQLKKEIAETDMAMSNMATKDGFHKAILFYADKSIVKFREGQYPVVDKKSYAEIASKQNDIKTVSWKPIDVEVAKSGDLGYSWGDWKDSEKDTILYGNYFTVWKRQADGTWKVALDCGGNTPKPK
jgi:ketosteroid isomerase-like protein